MNENGGPAVLRELLDQFDLTAAALQAAAPQSAAIDTPDDVTSALADVPVLLRQAHAEMEQFCAAAEGATSLEDALLHALIDAMPIGVVTCDAGGRIVMTNAFGEAILGTRVTGSIEQPQRDYVLLRPDGSEFPVDEMPLVRALAEGVSVRDVEILIRRAGQDDRVLLSTAAPVWDAVGQLAGGVVIFEDITMRKQAERQARVHQRERNILRVIMENTHAQLAYLDPDFNFITVNSTYAQAAGYAEAELIGRNHFDLFPDAENQAIFECVRDSGEAVEFQAKPFENPRRPELGLTYWDWTLTPVTDGNGMVEGLVFSLVDVTQQQRNQQALRRYADRLRVLHEIDVAILGAGSAEEIADRTLEYLRQLVPCQLMSVELIDGDTDESSVLAVNGEGERRLEERWCQPLVWREPLAQLREGRPFVVEDVDAMPSSPLVEALRGRGIRSVTSIPLIVRDELIGCLNLGKEQPGGVTPDELSIIRNLITQLSIGIQQARLYAHLEQHADELERIVRKRTQALRISEARLRAIFEGVGIGIALVDRKGRIRESNLALQELLGYSAEELSRGPLHSFSHANDVLADVASFVEAMGYDLDGWRRWQERLYTRRDGRLCWIDLTVSLVEERGGEPQFAILILEDVTERRRAREALIQSEKLAITGTLAASFAHEINNPLQSVIGCLELVAEGSGDEEETAELIQMAMTELDRAAGIVRQLRDMNRPSNPEEKEPTDPAVMVERVLALTRKQRERQGVEAEWAAPVDLPRVMVVPDRIQQVFLNLTLNAVESMADGGRLTVEARATAEPLGVRISFADTGKGLSAEMLSHLFEPFHTTKSNGLGLGLYVTHNIVKEHAGHIEVESRAGEGATFSVWLPAV